MLRPFRTLTRAAVLLCLPLTACTGSGASQDTGRTDTGPIRDTAADTDTGVVDTGAPAWFGPVTLAHCAAGGAMTRGPVRAVVCLAPADAGADRVEDAGWTFEAGPTHLLSPSGAP